MLKLEDDSLNGIISKENLSYSGTNPLEDAKKIYEEQMKGQGGEDPFDIFGHGIISYFRMIESLICVFFVCSLLFIPVFYLYCTGGAFNSGSESPLALLTLGNLGHAETFCEHTYLSLNGVAHFHCTKGKISNLHFVGLMPSQGGHFEPNYCAEPSKHKEIHSCSTQHLSTAPLKAAFTQQCQGSSTCKFQFHPYINSTTDNSCTETYSKLYF